MKVVGIDPSLTRTGIAVKRDEVELPYTASIVSKGTKGDSWDTRSYRLTAIVDGILEHTEYAGLVVMEGPSYASASTSVHDRAGLWWLVYRELRAQCSEVVVVSPAQRMMYATGKGRADKASVMAAAIRRYPQAPIGNDDEADAYLFLAMGLRILDRPIDDLPKTHLRALDKLAVPAHLVTR